MTDITYDESAQDFILDVFGWETDEFGFVVDHDDNFVLDTRGSPIMDHQIAGIVTGGNGEPRPLRDNINDIMDYARVR